MQELKKEEVSRSEGERKRWKSLQLLIMGHADVGSAWRLEGLVLVCQWGISGKEVLDPRNKHTHEI